MHRRVDVLYFGDPTLPVHDTLAETPGFSVVTARDETRPTAVDRTDCVVLDWSFPDEPADALTEIRTQSPETPVVVLGPPKESVADRALETGAAAYVPRTAGGSHHATLSGHVRRLTEERAHVGEKQRFVELFENFPEPTISYGFEDGTPVFRAVNDAFEQRFGYDADELLGQPVNELIVPESESTNAAQIDDRAQSGAVVDREVQRETANGKRLFQLRNIPVTSGELIDGYAVYDDITERVERKRELERYEVIVETMPTGLFLLDETGRIIAVNDQLSEMFDGAGPDIHGRSLTELAAQNQLPEPITEAYLSRVSDHLNDAQQQDDAVFTDELRIETGESFRYYDLRVSAVEGAVETGGYVVLLHDITDKKRREKQLREREAALEQQKADLEAQKTQLEYQNDQLDAFAGLVSHDLRNPLNVALGRLSMVANSTQQADDPAVDTANLDAVQEALERMQDIIEDALTLARQGRAITETAPVCLAETVEDAWSNVETREATLEAPPSVEIETDRDRLLNAFENLFRNAVEHGGTDVTVDVGLLEDGFYVEDDGPGIPKEDRDSVFEEGFTTETNGTGFGLAIVQRVVRAHGWEISVGEGKQLETGSPGARFDVTGATFPWTVEGLLTDLTPELSEPQARERIERAMADRGIDRRQFDETTARILREAIQELDSPTD